MFAYCGNNPVNYVDNTGNFPWHIIVASIIGGGVSTIVALMHKSSFVDTVLAGLMGAGTGAIIAAYPQSAIYFTSADMIIRLFNCIDAGYTFEETVAIMGLSMFITYNFKSTGDDLVDKYVDMTFGTAKEVISEGFIAAIEDKHKGTPTIMHNISSAATNGLSGGGRGGYVIMNDRYSVLGDLAWL